MAEKGQERPRRSTGVFVDIDGLCRFWDLSHVPLLSVCVNMLWPNLMARDDRRLVASLWPRTHTRNWQSSSEFRGGVLPTVERHLLLDAEGTVSSVCCVFQQWWCGQGWRRTDQTRSTTGMARSSWSHVQKNVLRIPSENFSPQVPLLIDLFVVCCFNSTLLKRVQSGCAIWLQPHDLCHLPGLLTAKWRTYGTRYVRAGTWPFCSTLLSELNGKGQPWGVSYWPHVLTALRFPCSILWIFLSCILRSRTEVWCYFREQNRSFLLN